MRIASDAAVIAVAVVAAVAAVVAAALAELLLLFVRARVRHGSVQSIVHVSAPRANMCTPVCSRLKLHASLRPVGADQRT